MAYRKRDEEMRGLFKRHRIWYFKRQRKNGKDYVVCLHEDTLPRAIIKAEKIRQRLDAVGGDLDELEAHDIAAEPPRYVGDPYDEDEPSQHGEVVTELLVQTAQEIEAKRGFAAASRWFSIASGERVALSAVLKDKKRKHKLTARRCAEIEWAVRHTGCTTLQDCTTKQQAHKIVDRLLDDGAIKRSSVQAVCRNMATLYSYAQDVGLYDGQNPWHKLRIASEETLKRSLTLVEWAALNDVEKDEREQYIFSLIFCLCHLGVRLQELCTITPNDIQGAGLHIRGTKTAGSDRVLQMVPPVAIILRKLAADCAPEQKLVRWHQSSIWRRIRVLYEKAGINTLECDTHSCRRLTASALSHTSVQEHIASFWMGHVYKGSLTFSRYAASPTPEQLLSAAFAVQDYLTPGGKYELAQRLNG